MSVSSQCIKVGTLEWFYRQTQPSVTIAHEPVILLHGLPSQSYSWRGVLPELDQQGIVAIAPDWPGYGLSSKPDKKEFLYTPEAFLGSLSEFLDILELTKFTLVIQGFLGSVGLQYALRHPERIEKLILLNTPLATTARLPWALQQMGLPLIGEMLTQDPLVIDRTLEAPNVHPIPDAALEVYRKGLLTSSAAGKAIFATVRSLSLPLVTNEIMQGLKTWEKPLLLLWGVKDPWLPLSLAESLVKQLPHADLIKLAEAGHYPQEDQPQQTAGYLTQFLRMTSKSGGSKG